MFHVKHACHHIDRRVLVVQGDDRFIFLQGLVTNDVYQLMKNQMLYSAMLTPQGKFLFDFFMSSHEEVVLLDCCADAKDQIFKKLNLYKLRARVTIQEASDEYSIYSIHNGALNSNLSLDPRCAQLGYRMIIKTEEANKIFAEIPVTTTRDYYEHLRLSLGIPEALKDMIPDKSIPLECNLDQLNAISWSKGCYVGQELTARTHYRGVIRKRLLPVKILGDLPTVLHPAIFQMDQEVGTLYSHNFQYGIARLKLENIQESLMGSQTLTCGSSRLTPYVPEWMNLK